MVKPEVCVVVQVGIVCEVGARGWLGVFVRC